MFPSVIFLTTGLAYGGAETQLVNLATRLKKRGWDVCVVSMLPPQAFMEELAAAGIPLSTLNMRRGMPDPRAVFRLVKILRQWRPDILHCHMVHANLLGRVVRVFYRILVVISTAHNMNEGGRWREIAYRMTDFLADKTTNVSRAAVDRYIRVGAVPKDKIIFMPNGIDTFRFQLNQNARLQLRRELGLNENFVWLAVGRFEEAKDYPNLLQAFKSVTDERNDAALLIAGQGTLFEDIK
ncbi:glycosyltransferase [Desulfofundulus salinus]|uniref:glycosyltransferase n=1 Tax=Desulfofundulus salinus TaxID=2419843 RepID=UPI001A9C214C|nr:glycosyltransferase [Desulfofundulus salinum]